MQFITRKRIPRPLGRGWSDLASPKVRQYVTNTPTVRSGIFIEHGGCLIKEYTGLDDPARTSFLEWISFRNGNADLFLELADWAGVYKPKVISLFVDECRQIIHESKFRIFLRSLDNLIAGYGEMLAISALSPDCILKMVG